MSGSLASGVWHFSAILVPECEQSRSRRGSEEFWKGLFISYNQNNIYNSCVNWYDTMYISFMKTRAYVYYNVREKN